MKEEWRDIEGLEGFYQVSSAGRVRSFNKAKGKDVKGKPRILYTKANNSGYLLVWTCLYGRKKALTIHRLVAKAFVSNPEGKEFVNHKNGVKTDNRVDNLEWCTRRENMAHAHAKGLAPRYGVKNSQAKLTPHAVKRMRLMREISPSMSYKNIGALFGVGEGAARDAILKIKWSHIQ